MKFAGEPYTGSVLLLGVGLPVRIFTSTTVLLETTITVIIKFYIGFFWESYDVFYSMETVQRNIGHNAFDLLSKYFVGVFFWA